MQKNITACITLCGLLTAANIALAMENLKLNIACYNPETNSPHYTPRSHRELATFLAAVSDDKDYVYTQPEQSYFTAQKSPQSTLLRSLSTSPIDDYDLTKHISSSDSKSGSQPNSPRKQEVSPTLLKGHYANKLNTYTRTLPIHTLIESTPESNNADYISYKNNQTNKLETILFHSDMEYKKERYIIVFCNSGNENWISNATNENFILEINPDDATNLEKTPQDKLQRQQSIETLKKLKSKLSTSSNSDSEKDKEATQNTSQSRYPQHTGYFTNNLDPSTSSLPIYAYIGGEYFSDEADYILCKDKETSKSKAILFYFPKNKQNEVMQCNEEKYIVIVDDENKPMFTIEINQDETTQLQKSSSSQSPENSSEEIAKKGLALLEDKFGSSSNSDSEKEKEKTKLSGYLTGNHTIMPENITVYEGTSISKVNNSTCLITYNDEHGIFQTISVNNTPTTDEKPTYAIIEGNSEKEPKKELKFVIDLQNIKQQDQQTKSTTSHKQAFTPKNSKDPHNGYGLRHAVMGTAFIAFCVAALAYKYDQLPDVVAQFIDNLIARCNNFIPSRFTH